MAKTRDDYRRLRSYFPSADLRARALGVSRSTIALWDSRRAQRRGAVGERLEHILRLAEMADEHMPSPMLTGRWLLAPQPFLYGQSAAEFLRRSPAAPQILAGWIAPAAAPVTEANRQSLEQAWPSLVALSGANARDGVESP